MASNRAQWHKLILAFSGLEEGLAQELVARLSEQCEALGAAETAQARGKSEWALFFPHDRGRAPIEDALKTVAQQTLDEIPGQAGIHWRWEIQADENWAVAWREYFRPFDVAPRFRIVPPWESSAPPGPPTIQISIEPGLGFGTGRHETTRLCMEALPGLVGPATRVLDVGSGSGILSIAAALLGAAWVVGLEIDSGANANARQNIRANAVARRVALVEGGPEAVAGGVFDLVVCNMILSSARPLFPQLANLTARGGTLVLSGFLEEEAEGAKSLFGPEGGRIVSCETLGEWGRLIWRKC